MDYFIDAGELGSDRNSGTHRRSPCKTLAGGMALALKDKDRLLIRQGGVFNESLTVPFNGVTLAPYSLALEPDHPITLRIPRTQVGARALSVTGQDNTFEQITIEGAETGVYVDPLAVGNTFNGVHITDWGAGFVIHASHTRVIDPIIKRGRMIKNVTSEDYRGASAITLWKHERYACTDIRIMGAHIEDAWAWRVPKADGKETDGDGAGLEIFGGVKDAMIEDMTVLNSKVLVEIGGTKGRNETVSNIRFVRCSAAGPSGKVFFANDPMGTFAIAWQGVSFDQCTFLADGYKESPFFMAGNHGDLSKKLSLTNSTVVASAQIINGGAGTLLDTFLHTGNTFWRSDGGTSLGFTLRMGDVFAEPVLS